MSAETDFETLSRLIRNRRTIKPAAMDTDREIPRDLLDRLLEDATWAPTHGMTEPWRFHIYEGEARAELASKLQALYQKLIPADQFRQDKFEKLGKNPMLAPVVLMLWMKRQEIEKIPEIEEVEAVACAVQNLHLSASAAGLGGFWSSPPLLYHEAVNQSFDMDKNDRCLGLFYLGWPAPGSPWPESQREPFTTKVKWFDGGTE